MFCTGLINNGVTRKCSSNNSSRDKKKQKQNPKLMRLADAFIITNNNILLLWFMYKLSWIWKVGYSRKKDIGKILNVFLSILHLLKEDFIWPNKRATTLHWLIFVLFITWTCSRRITLFMYQCLWSVTKILSLDSGS